MNQSPIFPNSSCVSPLADCILRDVPLIDLALQASFLFRFLTEIIWGLLAQFHLYTNQKA